MSISTSVHVESTDVIESHRASTGAAWLTIRSQRGAGTLVVFFRDDSDVTRTIAALMELRHAMRERAGLPDEAVPELVQ